MQKEYLPLSLEVVLLYHFLHSFSTGPVPNRSFGMGLSGGCGVPDYVTTMGKRVHKLLLLIVSLISLVYSGSAHYDYPMYDSDSGDPSQSRDDYVLAITSILNGKYTLSPYGFLSVDVGKLSVTNAITCTLHQIPRNTYGTLLSTNTFSRFFLRSLPSGSYNA